MKKIALRLKSTVARLPVYNRTKPEKIVTAFSSYLVKVTTTSFLLLLVQRDKKFLEESISLTGTSFFLTTFGNKSMRKV